MYKKFMLITSWNRVAVYIDNCMGEEWYFVRTVRSERSIYQPGQLEILREVLLVGSENLEDLENERNT